jgi:hypothetical protein
MQNSWYPAATVPPCATCRIGARQPGRGQSRPDSPKELRNEPNHIAGVPLAPIGPSRPKSDASRPGSAAVAGMAGISNSGSHRPPQSSRQEAGEALACTGRCCPRLGAMITFLQRGRLLDVRRNVEAAAVKRPWGDGIVPWGKRVPDTLLVAPTECRSTWLLLRSTARGRGAPTTIDNN